MRIHKERLYCFILLVITQLAYTDASFSALYDFRPFINGKYITTKQLYMYMQDANYRLASYVFI